MDISSIRLSARKVASKLFSLEESIENSMVSTTELLQALAEARKNKGVTVFHGQDALEEISSLLGTLASCRRQASEIHKMLHRGQAEVGLQGVAFGPVGKPSSALPADVDQLKVA